MTLTPYVPKGKRSFARGNFVSIYMSGNRSYPPFTNAGVPTDGTSGTLVGIAEPGSLLIDTTNKTLYQNSNTKASPTWTIFTTASGSGAFTGTFNGTVGATSPNTLKATTMEGTDTTDSSSSTTGALITAGGLGVAKKVYVGTDLHVGGIGYMSAADTITAKSGGGQGSATALTKVLNRVTVSAADTDSVKLIAATAGAMQMVFNDDSAQDIAIFPSTGDTIDGGSANASVTLGQGKRCLFVCFTAGAWISAQLGAVSGA